VESPYSESNWRRENTSLSYEEWVEYKIESDMEEIEALNLSCEGG
jgi:hypothetical protein